MVIFFYVGHLVPGAMCICVHNRSFPLRLCVGSPHMSMTLVHYQLNFCPIIMVQLLPPSRRAGFPARDRAVLCIVYASNGGARWLERTREYWNSGKELSLWSGVTINEERRVVKLDLSGSYGNQNNLTGEEIGLIWHRAVM